MKRGSQNTARGFTIIEMMIAMLLGLLIISGVVAVFLSNKQSYTTNAALSQVQDNSRTAFELLSRDIRETGLTGCGNAGRVANVLNNGPNNAGTTWWADIGNAIIGYDGGTADPAVTSGTGLAQRAIGFSSIQLVGGDGVGVTVAAHNTATAVITINESSSPVAAGDIVVVCDPDHAVIAQTTSVAAGPPIALTLATGAGTGNPGNCSTGLGLPTQCTSAGNVYQYAANSQIAKLYAVDWYIGYNNVNTTSLYRRTLVNTAGVPTPTSQEMVRNVTGMTITYHVPPSTGFVSAATVGANWPFVDSVLITLQVTSTSKTATTNAQALTRPISIAATLRNRMQ